MNYNDLKTDFKTRYFTKDEPSVVFAGKPLFLLGEETHELTGGIFTLLSAGTALAFNLSKGNSCFTVQDADTNIAYVCSKKDIPFYKEDNFARKIFKKIDELCAYSDIPCMDMLFKNNTNSPDFFNYSDALLSAVSCILKDKFPQHLLPPDVSAGQALLYENSASKYSEAKVSFPGKRLIVVTLGLKKQPIAQMCKNALTKLPNNTALSEDINTEAVFSGADRALICFMLNEKKRIEHLKSESDFDKACRIITASGRELFSLSSSDKLLTMQNILSGTDTALAYRPTLGNSAVYVITEDCAVDSLIQKIETEYEKKAGSKPTFYICDIGSHHIIH